MRISIFFLALWMLSSSAIAEHSCLIGKPRDSFYIDQLNKQKLDPDADSFLAYYREHGANLSPTAAGVCFAKDGQPCELSQEMTPEVHTRLAMIEEPLTKATRISEECISAALKTRRLAGLVNQCASRNSNRTVGKTPPCINDDIVRYMSWTINQAIECLSPANDPIEPEAIYKMMNLESGFQFYIYGVNGVGLTQLTGDALHEIHGYYGADYTNASYDSKGHLQKNKKLQDHYGKVFVDNILKSHPEKCKAFSQMRDYDIHFSPFKTKSGATVIAPSTCQLTSLGDGLARNIFDGIALYLYYRGIDYNSMNAEQKQDCAQIHCVGTASSADRMLNTMGLKFASQQDRIKIRSLMALSLYNAADGVEGAAAIKDLQPAIMAKSKRNGKISAEDFLTAANERALLDYPQQSEKVYNDIVNALKKQGGNEACTYPQYGKGK